MTLVVALQSIDGMALATDSRSTIGDPRGTTAMNDTANKLFRLSDHCALIVSEAAELANTLVDELQRHISKDDIDKIVVDGSKQFRSRYAEWFKDVTQENRPVVHFIMSGLARNPKDTSFSIPRTYLLSSQTNFAIQLATDGCMMAGIVQYAIYLKHRFYDPNMEVDQAIRLAIYLISETATQDPKVGGSIKAAHIIPTGYSQLSEEEVEGIIRENGEQNKTLKSFFIQGVHNGD